MYPCEGMASMVVEGLVHRLLADARRTGEWFETTLEEVDAAVKTACENPASLLTDKEKGRYDTAMLRNGEPA